jgi:hypothetical protein
VWTYGGDPSANTKDEVRFLLGDTVQADPQVSDEEIAYLLGKWPDPYTAAAQGAAALSATYSRLIDRTVGTLSISYSQKSQQFAQLAKDLRAQARSPEGAAGAAPLTFGIAWAEKDEKDLDTSLVPDVFDQGMHDNPDSEPDLRRGLL